MVKDHLGNEYKSLEEMCSAYDISHSLYWHRKKNGWDLEKILTTPVKVHKKSKWTDEEIQILKEKFPIQGANIPELLLCKTRDSIRYKARTYNLKYNSEKTGKSKCYSNWTYEEIEILKEKFPTHGVDIPELTHKKRKAIYSKAYNLRLGYLNKWTDEEIQILKEKYPLYGPDIPELEYRKRSSICAKAEKLGLGNIRSALWTEEEIEILKLKYPLYGSDIPELKRPKTSISSHARKFKIKFLKDEQYKIKYIGKTEFMHCGIYAKIIEYNDNNNIKIMFDSGETKKTTANAFNNKCVGHPTLKTKKNNKGYFKGFITQYMFYTEKQTLYTCECQKCKELYPNEKNKYRFVMNPYQMIEHEKLHKGE